MKYIGLILIVTGLFSFGMKSDKTLENLQEAYKEEALASKKYEQFAFKAEEEGYSEIAELFAALSESESVHMSNHKRVIEEMGATPEQIPDADIEVRSTKKNLKEVVKDEKKENRSKYPKLIKQAEKEENCAAVEAFSFADESEKQHYELLNKALDEMEQFEDGDYYVSDYTGRTFKVEPNGNEPEREFDNEEYIRVFL